MKRVLALLPLVTVAALLLTVSPVPAGPKMKGAFQPAMSETDETIYQVKLFPSGRAYACGTDGVVLSATDGGTYWEWTQIKEGIDIKVMHWADELHGYFSARFRTEDRYYLTTDGAKSFRRFRVDLDFPPRDFAFLSARKGIVVAGSHVEKDGGWRFTTDGGKTWKSPESGDYFIPARALFAATTVGAKHYFVVGGHVESTMVGDAARCVLYQKKEGAVLHSPDEGATWEVLDAGNPAGVYLYAVDFTDTEQGWVAGEKGFLSTTTDGGKTWKVRDSGTEERLLAIDAVDDKVAFAVGYRGTAIATRDGGETWSALNSRTKVHLRDCSFIDDKTGFACGKNGRVLRFARQF